MTVATRLAQVARSPGDPSILETGPGSLGAADRLARALGWFSLGLGMVELLAAPRVARALGMDGYEGLVRACGMREIAAGMMMLSANTMAGPVARLAGDGIDMATLMAFRGSDNPERKRVGTALAVVGGIALLDALCIAASSKRHGRRGRPSETYSDRSGLPKGVEASRGLARESFETPKDLQAAPRLAYASGAGRRPQRPGA